MLADGGVAAQALGAQFELDTDAHVTRVLRTGDDVEIEFRGPEGELRTERSDYVLAATGRVPNVDRLGLENAGCVLTGVACSGYYVRSAQSPFIEDLATMLRAWPSRSS